MMFKKIERGIIKMSLPRDYRLVSRSGLTYLSAHRLSRLERSIRSVKHVPGDFCEFGVALGGSSILIARRARNRAFHGFDVFGMIPEPTSEKDDATSKGRYQIIRSGSSRGLRGQTYYGYRDDLYSEVCGSLAAYGVPVDGKAVVLHKGLFEDTLPKSGINRIAFAHIDCDWYDPVRYCLNFIADRMSPDGVILLDDYHDYGGARTAVDEFLSQRPDYSFEDGTNPILRRSVNVTNEVVAGVRNRRRGRRLEAVVATGRT